jgi:hypothetical protein
MEYYKRNPRLIPQKPVAGGGGEVTLAVRVAGDSEPAVILDLGDTRVRLRKVGLVGDSVA